MRKKLVIGMDFGTDSARGLVVDTSNGKVLSTAVAKYKRWSQGLFCKPELEEYRQHPLDYIEVIDDIFQHLFEDLPVGTIQDVLAIGTNTTGSTPLAVDEYANPLSLNKGFENNPNAMFVLWKDHTAKQEADEINALLKKWPIDYSKYSGGVYSSEWFWAKLLHINRKDKNILDNTFTWVEQSDWIPNYLVGNKVASKIKRNRCAAGHKAMWNLEHGGLPSPEFLCVLDPSFYLLLNRFYKDTFTSDEICGNISSYFVDKFGFNSSTLVTIGGIDAHHGAVGAGSKPYAMVKVIGTSTCDMLVAPNSDNLPIVAGICGQVDGSIDPGMIGFEAGQSAYGDIFNWYKKVLLEPTYAILKNNLPDDQKQVLEDNLFAYLTEEAEKIKIESSNIVFTDYFNGRRSPDADFSKSGIGCGFNLATNAGHIFKALVEATAFGSRAIMERFLAYNIPIHSVIATGGIPNKSPYVVQVLADVMGCDIEVVESNQVCALGSAIFASVAAGVYDSVEDAKDKMSAAVIKVYSPTIENQEVYNKLYEKYQLLTQI